jgi:uncharacterized protein YwgA
MTMTDLQRSAVIATLVKDYRARRFFCGETHVQKSVYFMQEIFAVPLGFQYLLYKYGPFSFELQGHLAAMRADDMLIVRPLEYAATFEPGDQLLYLEQNLPRTIETHRAAINFAVTNLAGLGVKQLEPLATALYFTSREQDQSVDSRAAKILEVKPHIQMDEANAAVKQIDRWREEASRSGPLT